MRYFAYGSNMSRARLEGRLGRVVDLGRARCAARRHRFSKLGLDGTGKGNIELAEAELVWGVVYELDAAQLERLTGLELGYRRVELEVELEMIGPVRTASFEALLPTQDLAPTREYLEHYVVGMREHGIPDAYLAAVLGEFHRLVG
ncbi:MAG TPA: gamma-glutamylcyclotransferase family protein [Enhygromyxa sp.]|nr:gamma-glutamylcyclotransferase family protein [Enhygromyxa sp.]